MQPLTAMVTRALRGLMTRLGSGPQLSVEQVFYRFFHPHDLTEEQWHTSTDALALLNHLHGRASARKLRLLAAACCRALPVDPVEVGTHVADVAERVAEGRAEMEELHFAAAGAETPLIQAVTRAMETQAAWEAVRIGQREQGGFGGRVCELVRELFGNPFRPVTIEPSWLLWREGLVSHMACTIHDRRQFDDLAILADALEEAGCDDVELLSHCRRPGGHVPGCWALDSLMSAEAPAP
jgi:hypothetical protein